ncbi:MAG: hypothetical protein WB949_12455 [Candidatus Acidiferrales bacterium]
MVREALIQNHADGISNRHFHAPQRRKLFQTQAEEVEARIQQLSDRFKNLNSPANFVWLKDAPYLHDPDLDFYVKVEAVRWMLRIAKHMSEPAREVVFLRIENSLRQLEAAVESGLRAAEPFAESARPRRAACA